MTALLALSVGASAQAPANDNCVDAAVAVGGDNAFTTIQATTDGLLERVCDPPNFLDINNDVWFKYSAECTGNLTASICGALFDSKIAIYDGCEVCPPTVAPIGCDDDFCAPFGASQVTVPVNNRDCYLIRIGGSTPQILDTGTGTLSISCDVPPPPTGACCDDGSCVGTLTEAACTSAGGTSWVEAQICPTFACPIPPPPNDLCAACSAVATNSSVNGTTTGAGGIDESSCSSQDFLDTWHCWTADCTGLVTFSLCDPDPGLADPMSDPTLAVFDACGGSELACNDDSSGCGPTARHSRITLPVTTGTQYVIRVSGFSGERGDYTLDLSECIGGQVTGACCFDQVFENQCANVTLEQCNNAPNGTGIWSGPGTTCAGGGGTDAFCALGGACCDHATCAANMNESACANVGGSFWAVGESCPAFACPVPDPVTWLDHNGTDPDGYLPDFDQNSDFDNADGDGDPATGVDPFYNGPAAVADALWWLNGSVPGRGIVAAATPRELVQNLAVRMATSGQTASPNGHATPYNGTFFDDLRSGVRQYLTANALAGVLVEQAASQPSYATVTSHALLNRVVTLQLGFYRVTAVFEPVPGAGTFIVDWRRSGGQYVTVAGANVAGVQIGLADPDGDRAEAGGEGQVRGADHAHDGDADPGTTLPFRDASYDHGRHHAGKTMASQDVFAAAPAFVSDSAVDQWQLVESGDGLAYGAAQDPFHVGDAGGSFDLVSSSIVDAAFLTANGYADPAVGQIYSVVESALILGRFGDSDGNRLIDLTDHVSLADCLNGPGVIPAPTPPAKPLDCLAAFDADGDGDVDIADAAHFPIEFTGP